MFNNIKNKQKWISIRIETINCLLSSFRGGKNIKLRKFVFFNFENISSKFEMYVSVVNVRLLCYAAREKVKLQKVILENNNFVNISKTYIKNRNFCLL